ncbi:glycine zipper 2TM domain-containing protein [Noviherbaspirillum saxi]|uniref:Glycine zipper 2TM domain-containing protein n=1 Tax=Noviherbaspirillum saxi TaxID=2320863 RepID=A0A3A3FT37_9BURK|nr:glycine zipper 2TM domain-containing protein [Noviherbaspirillum saxi]RJF99216.1 glycine zipper 2TM domain-containing protein [Noviherbaspirillum saxi]
MNAYSTRLIALSLAAGLLAGCASPGYPPIASQPYPAPAPAGSYPTGSYPTGTYPASSPSYAYSYGVVDSIQMRQAAAASGNGIGVGTVVGGVVGGMLGNQVGGGTGRKAATVAGVIGGAMVGNQMERNNQQVRDAFQIGVRMDNGSYRTILQDSAADLYVGSRVRVENDRVYRQ